MVSTISFQQGHLGMGLGSIFPLLLADIPKPAGSILLPFLQWNRRKGLGPSPLPPQPSPSNPPHLPPGHYLQYPPLSLWVTGFINRPHLQGFCSSLQSSSLGARELFPTQYTGSYMTSWPQIPHFYHLTVAKSSLTLNMQYVLHS